MSLHHTLESAEADAAASSRQRQGVFVVYEVRRPGRSCPLGWCVRAVAPSERIGYDLSGALILSPVNVWVGGSRRHWLDPERSNGGYKAGNHAASAKYRETGRVRRKGA
jgi:hypothetical protein